MNLIVFLSFFLHAAAMAACRPDTVPHTLDRANAQMISQLLRAASAAAPEEEPACDQSLPLQREDMSSWIDFLDRDVDFMAADEDKWAQEILARKVPMDASEEIACSLDRDLTELEDFYQLAETRQEELDQRISKVASIVLTARAEKEIFAQPEKAKLLIECRDEFREQSDGFDDEHIDIEEELGRRDACLTRADATPELWEAVKHMEKKSSGAAAGLACVLSPGFRAETEKNLEMAGKVEAGLKKLLTDTNNYFESLSEKIPGRIFKIIAARKGLEAWGCPAWLAAEDRKIQSSVRKLQAVDLHGSGFVLAGPNGKPELVSARHVGFSGDSFEPNQLKVLGIHAEKQPRYGIEFEVKPGDYDRGKDLVKRPLSSARTAFTAVAEGTVLPPGEKVRIFGHPANREGKFTSHGCEVKGIGHNVYDTPDSESYLLFCPGAESHIAGMSGGPVTNGKGEVIGVISAHDPFTNMVVVQPVSRNAKGENRFGFPSAFSYDKCFESGISKPKRCRIIPGLSFQKSVP